MKIKTNVRAGKNGADDVGGDTSSSTSSSKQKQNGKSSTPAVPVSRCVGI
ncbi:MAG: hypothetical protein JNM08_01045 [Rubrivivax sp.]|nr:hypothetical protein [Rubrivivax sp.]